MIARPLAACLLLAAALGSTHTVRGPAGGSSAAGAPPPPSPGAPHPPPPATSRCLPPSGEGIPAESILRDLREGKDVVLSGRIIEGSLDVDQAWPPADERRASLRVVPGALKLESCRVEGRVAFPRSVLVKGLELPCTEIRGDLDLTDGDVGVGLVAPRAHVLGASRLSRALVHGPVVLTGAMLDDHLDLAGVRCSGPLSLDGAELRRDVDVSRAVLQAFDLSSARIRGRTSVQDLLVLTELGAREANFVRGLQADGVRVVGRADLSGARGAGGYTLSDWNVGGDFFFDLAADGPVSIAALEVGRDLSLLDGVFQSVSIDRLHVRRRSEFEGAHFKGRVVLRDSEMGVEFTASEAVFEGETEFQRVRFPGEDPMEGALFASAPNLVETVLPRPPTVRSGDEEVETDDDEGIDDEPDEEP